MMERIKVTAKLIISCVLVSALGLFMFEFTYNKTVYRKYVELQQEVKELDDDVDYLTGVIIRLQQRYNELYLKSIDNQE